MINGEERSGTVRNGEERSDTVDGEGRSGTVRDGQGLWCHDGGRSVTMGHDDLKMVTGRQWDGNGTKSKFLLYRNVKTKILTVNFYFVPQGQKARTWIMPQGSNSVIKSRIDLKLGENASPDLADKIHFDS